jgi:DNA invertase Pin-like site-specific DNA recombinase
MASKYQPEGMDAVVRKFRAQRGMPSAIARACGIERAAVYQWKRVPPQWVYQVSDIMGMKPEDVRPDIFRRPKKRK